MSHSDAAAAPASRRYGRGRQLIKFYALTLVSGKFSTNVQITLCIVAWTEAEEAHATGTCKAPGGLGLRGRDRHETYHCAMISQEIIHLSTYCNGFATLPTTFPKK
ncbi:hypothetical protein EVAR_90822_1 [Eumeta japonica]|uniref:Uncharacterized protein n=1 Tax=Eumeta variegata TaxID=151549 RepID=A0A4C1SC36_EUMVA|nr:hypothetical protein EVAR_90822_1 [Eumeta japonica]